MRNAMLPSVDVVVPVYNEAPTLQRQLAILHGFLDRGLPFTWQITIADNASTDQTLAIGRRLAQTLPRVRVIHLEQKGRGRALRAAWSSSTCELLAYTDVDLSTDLRALLPLLAGVASGHCELAIGSRLAPSARVTRSPRREFISRAYNLILRRTLSAGFSDAQCGFKVIRADVARALLPAVRDQNWFFDTELLILAQRHGLRIGEVAVDWVEDPDSRVHVTRTALEDLRGVARLRLRPIPDRHIELELENARLQWVDRGARTPSPSPVPDHLPGAA
ncbi:MAG TPA: dolichyl-phosphate beta-glucosyltransferase [Solirubrobacteraceae bacterium]|jgi:glycosyltransferase involved in cell wall biosynthesis|nr:dolichyl-phosphate beta-glucosyltransferase [Solirubrobacteraceae bacterium]